MEDKTLNPQTIKEIFPPKEYVCAHKISEENKKLYYENKYKQFKYNRREFFTTKVAKRKIEEACLPAYLPGHSGNFEEFYYCFEFT